jgi:hypothetical protein
MRRPSPGTAGPTIPVALGAVLVLYGVVSLLGITWGLPSRKIDKYLFGDGEVWSGEKIYRLAKADRKFDPTRGADVDVDPIVKNWQPLPSPQPSPLKGEEVAPIPLTATEADVAKIYLRYRLYTYQPDEMITMMALAGMRPSRLELDPRLYQYGGLFIYPVGALIKLCGVLGLIDVRRDVVLYLDHPDEFGKFYIVARAYSAVWGLIGVLVVYAITRRITSYRAAGFSPRDPEIRTPSASAGPNEKIKDRSSKIETASHARHGLLSSILAIRHSIFATRPAAAPSGSDTTARTGDANAHRAGLLAALLFTLMPVVVCMAHEGKPHLPGAVLMLLAVYFAMRYADAGSAKIESFEAQDKDRRSKIEAENTGSEAPNRQSAIDSRQSFRWMCVCCGAALGMVLSSWPIFVVIPLVAFRAAGLSPRARLAHTIKGVAIGLAVYLVTNPYILINAFANREVLRSNFGNSLAMYQIARIGEGFVRVVELSLEGATLPMVVVGLVGLFIAVVRRNQAAVPSVVVGAVFFLQFVLIGAGKPAEYGRFGIFTNTALAIATGCLLGGRKPRVIRWPGFPAAVVVAAWIAWSGYTYLNDFILDAGDQGSRLNLARFCSHLSRDASTLRITTPLATFAEPAPYCYPPIDFAHADLHLVSAASYTGHVDREAFAFTPVENADSMFPKYAEIPAFAPIFRTARFVDNPAWSTMLLHVDSAWRTMPTDSNTLAYRWRRAVAQRETPISWANKPFYDSVLHYLTRQQVVPLRR